MNEQNKKMLIIFNKDEYAHWEIVPATDIPNMLHGISMVEKLNNEFIDTFIYPDHKNKLSQYIYNLRYEWAIIKELKEALTQFHTEYLNNNITILKEKLATLFPTLVNTLFIYEAPYFNSKYLEANITISNNQVYTCITYDHLFTWDELIKTLHLELTDIILAQLLTKETSITDTQLLASIVKDLQTYIESTND